MLYVERKTGLYAMYEPNKRLLTRYEKFPNVPVGPAKTVHSLDKEGLNLAREPTVVMTRHPDYMFSPPDSNSNFNLFGRLFTPKTNVGKKMLREWIKYPLMNAYERKQRVLFYTKHPDECARIRKLLPQIIDVTSIQGILSMLECGIKISLNETPIGLMRHLQKFIGEDGIMDDNWPILYNIRSARTAKIKEAKRLFSEVIVSKDGFSVMSSKKDFSSMEGVQAKKYKKRKVMWSTAELNCLSNDFIAINCEIDRIEHEVIKECWSVVEKYDITSVVKAISETDLLTTFAEVAIKNNWCMAERSDCIDIKGLIHPLVEHCVPNDVLTKNTMVITGWNSSGKSTLMKAVGMAILLNQMGSFVPARHARLPIFDGVFAILKEDQRLESSFIHHCKLIAEIQKKCTQESFIMLDEPCNSTNAEAGMELAKRVLNNTPGMKMITTHYRFSDPDMPEYHLKAFKLQPGPSNTTNAFAFCKRLGLNDEMLI